MDLVFTEEDMLEFYLKNKQNNTFLFQGFTKAKETHSLLGFEDQLLIDNNKQFFNDIKRWLYLNRKQIFIDSRAFRRGNV